MRRLIIRSRLGNLVVNRGEKTQDSKPHYMVASGTHIPIDRYILTCVDTSVLVGVDRHRKVYLLGGFTQWDIWKQKWSIGSYHNYDEPKFIGHLQEII